MCPCFPLLLGLPERGLWLMGAEPDSPAGPRTAGREEEGLGKAQGRGEQGLALCVHINR